VTPVRNAEQKKQITSIEVEADDGDAMATKASATAFHRSSSQDKRQFGKELHRREFTCDKLL
jgi:hypothetical protein